MTDNLIYEQIPFVYMVLPLLYMQRVFIWKKGEFMKFSENSNNIITVPKYENNFVYFLLNDGEVVYVGQTKNGLIRPLSHRDKEFNEIKILYCDSDELDITEDKYIQKYKPIYNKQNNYAVRWSLKRVRDCIRNQTRQTNYTVPRLKKVLKELNIIPERDCFNGKETISFDEYTVVMEYIRRRGNGNA